MRTTRRAARENRWSIAGFAIAGFAIALVQSVAFFKLAGHTFAERAAFGYALELYSTANAVLLPPPIHPETVAGYLELRAFEPLAILFAAWALVSATTSSTVPIVPRAAAFGISTVVAAVAACVGVLVGVASGGEAVGGVGLVESGLLLVGLAVACYAICLFVAQLMPTASVVASALLLTTLFFLNGLGRVFTKLDVARWLSPFRYYDLSTPLPQGGHFDVGGFVVLLAIALLGIAAASFLSTRRVARTQPLRRATYEPSHTPLLAIPVVRDLYASRAILAAWCIAFAVLGVVLLAETRTTMEDVLALPRGLPGLPQYISVLFAQELGETWFDVALLMFVALAFTFTSRWTLDDRDGRLEAALSAPYSRSAVVIEQLSALALTAAVLAALSGLAVALTSHAVDLALDPTRVAGASLLLLLFGVVFGAAGLLLASWAPRAAPALLVAVVIAAYLDDQVGGALGMPGWAQDLSPFRLMGAPLANGIDGHNLALLVALILAGLGSSILAIQRRDVGA